MKQSLKSQIYSELKERGYLTLDQVHAIAHREGKKESNAERTLRPSNSGTCVETIYDLKKQVKGYKWTEALSPDVYTQEEINRRALAYHKQSLF